jgi:hypothetical protein
MSEGIIGRIEQFDDGNLGGTLKKVFGDGRALPARAKFVSHFDEKYVVRHQRSHGSLLASLCDKYGSDKGTEGRGPTPYPWPAHTYVRLYEQLFAHCRESITSVLECGIGTNNPTLTSTMGAQGAPGASLRVWRDYFPYANVIGVDIDRDILFEDDRITTHYVDQTAQQTVREMWASIGNPAMDLIIDDGLHTFVAARSFFEASVTQLKPTGIYVIEDVLASDLSEFITYFDGSPFDVDYVSLYRQGIALGDNVLIVVRHASTNA